MKSTKPHYVQIAGKGFSEHQTPHWFCLSVILSREECCANFWADVLRIPIPRHSYSAGKPLLFHLSVKFHKGVLLDSIQVHTLMSKFSGFFLLLVFWFFLAVCFGSLWCWNISLLASFWSLGVALSYPQGFMVSSINVISPKHFALMHTNPILSDPNLRPSLSGLYSLWLS